MSATLALAAILTLKDQFSAPLRAATAATEGIRRSMEGLSSSAARVSAALKGVAQSASSLGTTAAQLAAVGQITTGFGLESYIRNTIGVEHRLAALGNTASMSADDLKALDAKLSAAARATNQFKADLLAANEVLIAAGLEWRQAVDITPILGKVATATQASMGDLANTAYALTSSLKVPVEQMQAAFERLTLAGQSGQFELKDMAASFARIGASMGALKFTGLENVSRLGAALQIARRGAGDASEAANNLQNFLAKLAAPEVQKNFEKFGIDLPRLLKEARERGLDPFLVTLKAIQRATGGDEFKLGELFGDMQVQNFIKPMLLYADDYKRLVGEINAANGVLEGNFGRMMNTTAERWKQFRIQLETQPMPWLDDLIGQMSEWLQVMNEYPKVTSAIAKGLVGLAVAAVALKGVALVAGGIGAAIGGIGRIKDWLASRKDGASGKAGGLINAIAGGIQKVWVVNMPGGGLGGGLPDLGGSGGAGGKAAGAARTLGARLRSLVAGVMMQASLAWQAIVAWGGKVAAVAASAWSTIVAGAGAAARAIAVVGRAVLAHPIALTLAAVATAAYLVWRHWDAIGPKLAAVWHGVRAAFLNMTPVGQVIQHWETIKAAVASLPQALAGLPARMLAIGGQIVDGLLAGMRQRWASLKEGVTGMGDAITGWFKDKLGIRSPSRVFAEMGGHLMGGLQLGIQRAAGLPLAAMGAVAGALAAPLTAGAVAAGGAVGSAAAPIHITVNLNGPASAEAAQDVADAVRREVERLLSERDRRAAIARRAAMLDGGLA